jgi:hypothetical protein
MVKTRRRLRVVVGLIVATLTASLGVLALTLARSSDTASSALPPGDQRFESRPDLRPPAMKVLAAEPGQAPGLVLMAPKRRGAQRGPAILDRNGELVWFSPSPPGIIANDLRVQQYRGQPVLTWWEGKTNTGGYGRGTWVIADSSYREIARVRAGNGLHGDLHDMVLTARGTALLTIYDVVPADLSVVNSPFSKGEAVDSVIQEVDVASGRVLWQWRSLDHVALSESKSAPPKKRRWPYDYFHINSIAEDTDGNLLVSARNTWAIYKIDRKTGEVIWRLGGRRSDFALGPGALFAWQHDARRLPDGTISLFDNQATPRVGDESRGLVLDVDEEKRTATVVREFTHPDNVLSIAEGNAQSLPTGGMLLGWGIGRRVSEIGPDGSLLFDVRLPSDTDTYRAYRFPWTGKPARPPALAIRRTGRRITAYASWNGATEVTDWELLAGPSPDELEVIAREQRAGFETVIKATTWKRYVAVRALDEHGRPLATSRLVESR